MNQLVQHWATHYGGQERAMSMRHLLNDPARHLRRSLLPKTIIEAEAYLFRRLETASLLVACIRHTPWEVSKQWNQETLLPDGDELYSVAEQKCLELVDTHLFPFAREYLEESAAQGERMGMIPLHSFGIDHWSYGFDELNAGWAMLGLLNGDIDASQRPDLAPYVWAGGIRAAGYTRESWLWETFEAVCRSAQEPLCFLPVAIKMLDHTTDNLFLDPSDEAPVNDATWTLHDIELLTAHWREAQTMLDQAERLTGWLASDPRHMRKVADLWNLALWTMLMA